MVDNAKETNADVVVGRTWEKTGFYKTHLYDPVPKGVIGHELLMKEYYVSFFGVRKIPVLVWAKLYRRELLQRAQPKPHGMRDTDDLVFNMEVFPYAKKVSIIDDYVYVHNYGGFSSKYVEILPEYKKLFRERMKAVERYHCESFVLPMKIQMRNLLLFDMQLKTIKGEYDKQKLLAFLRNELADRFWAEIVDVDDGSPFYEALRCYDYERMYEISVMPLFSVQAKILRVLKSVVKVVIRWWYA